jgi:lysophospholipase L1-like esterase
MAEEARRDGAQLIVVGIPYLPQVYEDIRRTVFADARYDADALSRRVRAYSTETGALYIDTTPAMRRAAQATGRWLHYREDGHPTAEGHAVIARAILDAGVITRVSNGRH